MKGDDALFIAVVFGSIVLSVIFPRVFAGLEPIPAYCMMTLLFLSSLTIDRASFSVPKGRPLAMMACYLGLRLLMVPAVIFAVFQFLWPDYALSALLLGGISVGVVGPYMAVQLDADAGRTTLLVAATSALVPLTLPALAHLLAGAQVTVSYLAMGKFLALIILVPSLLAQVARNLAPAPTRFLIRFRQPLSLMLFALTNFGTFPRYADLFRGNPAILWQSTLAAMAIAALLFAIGLAWIRLDARQDGMPFLIGAVIVNNILVLVLASEYFGARESTAAALYAVPFFLTILPLRAVAARLNRRALS